MYVPVFTSSKTVYERLLVQQAFVRMNRLCFGSVSVCAPRVRSACVSGVCLRPWLTVRDSVHVYTTALVLFGVQLIGSCRVFRPGVVCARVCVKSEQSDQTG